MEINIDNWHEFEISELFDIKRLVRVSGDNGEYIKDHEIIDSNGTCPYIAAVSVNNGIKGYSNREPNNKGNCITFSTTTESATTVFYQPVDFVGRQQMVGIYGNSENEMSKERALFLIPIIKNNLLHFNYDNKLTYDNVLELSIKLPAIYSAEKEEYEPDWDYIEEFIKELKEENERKLSSLKTLFNPDNALVNGGGGGYNLDISDWHEFEIRQLFEVINSKPYHKSDVIEADEDDSNSVNYITRSKFNNGLLYKVEDNNNFDKNPKNTISFGAKNADFFIQLEEYITGNKMYYIDTQELTLNQSLFFKTVLQKTLTNKYGFNDGLTGERLKAEKILLPATYNNEKEEYEPDWEYMDNFIINLQEGVKDQLRRLKQRNE